MQKVYKKSGFSLLLGMLLLSSVGAAEARVNVGVNINIGPPPIVAPAPPEVVMVPSSQVYFVPGIEFDVFFYNGYWWSPRGDHWYRSRAYDGPWRTIERRYVPRPVIGVPHDYRNVYVRERRIPYGQWKKDREHHGKDKHHDRREYREQSEHRDRGDRHDRGDRGDRDDRGEHGDHGRGR